MNKYGQGRQLPTYTTIIGAGQPVTAQPVQSAGALATAGSQEQGTVLPFPTQLTDPFEMLEQHAIPRRIAELVAPVVVPEGIALSLPTLTGEVYRQTMIRGDLRGARYQRDDGTVGEWPKYRAQPGRGAIWRPVPNPDADTIVIVEGTKGHLAAAAYAPDGVEVWGIAGCYNWSSDQLALPELRAVAGRRVVIAFDGDVSSNRDVWTAAGRLAQTLTELGAANVEFVVSPQLSGTNGLDDLLADTPEEGRAARLAGLLANAKTTRPKQPAVNTAKESERYRAANPSAVEVTSEAIAAEWLRGQLGTGRLSGLFLRDGGHLVFTPREGEDGYVPLKDEVGEDGPAQVRPMSANELAARVQATHAVFRSSPQTGVEPALFPQRSAQYVRDALDTVPNLRPLRSVSHTPFVRRDGGLVTRPGYDQETATLLLPDAGLDTMSIPDQPSVEQVNAAASLISTMIAEFDFVSDGDRANYLGALLTPIIRELAPPAYKAVMINAHERGSGKSLLAEILRIVHGGVLRVETPPTGDEWRKALTSVLTTTTGPVVQFDNAEGKVYSSILAGLLTSATWSDRRLGVTQEVRARNDRLWVFTGNNLSVGGDLPRRILWVNLDPDVPHPELRTGFAIADLPRWVRAHRAGLIVALLVLVRAWVVVGMPQEAASSDSFARWSAIVRGILTTAGIRGTFDDPEVARRSTSVSPDESEWSSFLVALRAEFGTALFTTKDVVTRVDTHPGGIRMAGDQAKTIPLDALPEKLADVARGKHGAWSTTLGRWMLNRSGQYLDGLTVRRVGNDRLHVALWQIAGEQS